MKGSLKLGKIAGIGIFIHWTFSLLLLFIIFINYRTGYSALQTAWSVLFILVVFVTVLLHELGHALVAKNYHIKTKDITLLPIGGLAQLERIPEKPIEELLVSIAGPLVNLTLALLTGFFISVPETAETLLAELSKGINANNFFLNFFLVNIWLAIFNLIPAFPMDGGRVLRAILSFRFKRNVATKIAARTGQLLAVGFIILGFISNPFLIFIGLFVIVGAQIETEHAEAKYVLKNYKVRDVVMTQYQTIDADEKVEKAIAMLLDSQNKSFLVTENKEAVGTLHRDEIITALALKKENETIKEIMNKNLIFLDVDALLEDVFEKIYENKLTLMLVTENDKIIGTLDTENILEFILIKEVKTKKAYVNF
jgi:Zn-dependent protease